MNNQIHRLTRCAIAVLCSSVAAPTLVHAGACCFTDGTCTDVPEFADCDLLGGTYAGDDSECSTITCGDTDGACCLQDGSCFISSFENCFGTPGGVWQGATTNCLDVICPIVTDGACCLDDGTCIESSFENCGFDGGTFFGIGTICDDIVCEVSGGVPP